MIKYRIKEASEKAVEIYNRFRLVVKMTPTQVELATKGWSGWEISCGWDSTVMPRIGEQLIWFADNTIAYPGGEYTLESWRAEIRFHGENIIRATQVVPIEGLMGTYLNRVNMLSSPMDFSSTNHPEYETASETHRAIENFYQNEGRKSLHWLADNARGLWD